MNLTVSANHPHFELNGSPTFLVADTAWAAFADAEIEEWRQYVTVRAAQGFDTVLVSILPILHDRVIWQGTHPPFESDTGGHFQFDHPSPAFFARARTMAEIAHQAGLRLGLVLLWCNYVAETWGSEKTPWAVMTAEQRTHYLTHAVDTFADLQPLFIISGDERFSSPLATQVYLDALHQVKLAAPNCLTSMHTTPDAQNPETVFDSPLLDFYSYQAGHDIEHQDRAWALAESLTQRGTSRPIVDLEPCYEGHGYGYGAGRYNAAQVRQASWGSVLAGAKAGIGYGAHGLWQWNRPGATFTNPSFSLHPFSWQTALAFPGANDVAFLGKLVRDHHLMNTSPRQDLLQDPFPGLRLAATDDLTTIAIYLPDAREVRLLTDVDTQNITTWRLPDRTPIKPRLSHRSGTTHIEQVDSLGDFVVILHQ